MNWSTTENNLHLLFKWNHYLLQDPHVITVSLQLSLFSRLKLYTGVFLHQTKVFFSVLIFYIFCHFLNPSFYFCILSSCSCRFYVSRFLTVQESIKQVRESDCWRDIDIIMPIKTLVQQLFQPPRTSLKRFLLVHCYIMNPSSYREISSAYLTSHLHYRLSPHSDKVRLSTSVRLSDYASWTSTLEQPAARFGTFIKKKTALFIMETLQQTEFVSSVGRGHKQQGLTQRQLGRKTPNQSLTESLNCSFKVEAVSSFKFL